MEQYVEISLLKYLKNIRFASVEFVGRRHAAYVRNILQLFCKQFGLAGFSSMEVIWLKPKEESEWLRLGGHFYNTVITFAR